MDGWMDVDGWIDGWRYVRKVRSEKCVANRKKLKLNQSVGKQLNFNLHAYIRKKN